MKLEFKARTTPHGATVATVSISPIGKQKGKRRAIQLMLRPKQRDKSVRISLHREMGNLVTSDADSMQGHKSYGKETARDVAESTYSLLSWIFSHSARRR